MKLNIGVVMDPIESIKTYKDTTFAMMLAAQQRNHTLYYTQSKQLYLQEGKFQLTGQRVTVTDNRDNWFQTEKAETLGAKDLDVILMRQDPPFDIHYLNTTYLLDHAEAQGILVVNKPQALRDANEKIFTTWFPQCTVPYLISSQSSQLKAFLQQHQDVIFKPLDSMGGEAIFRVKMNDPNLNVILETLTHYDRRSIMAQYFIPEITQGDKRIILVNGEAIPYSLARLPAPGETRANLATGGTGEPRPLTEREHWICQEVGPTLKEKGIIFAGIDVIGDYLTEINVTSPTGIREIEQHYDVDIAGKLFDVIEEKLA